MFKIKPTIFRYLITWSHIKMYVVSRWCNVRAILFTGWLVVLAIIHCIITRYPACCSIISPMVWIIPCLHIVRGCVHTARLSVNGKITSSVIALNRLQEEATHNLFPITHRQSSNALVIGTTFGYHFSMRPLVHIAKHVIRVPFKRIPDDKDTKRNKHASHQLLWPWVRECVF